VRVVVRWVTALLLLAPAALGRAAPRAALQVSATVVRSVTVSVHGAGRESLLQVRAPGGGARSVALADAVRRGEARTCDGDRRCVVVTIHADAAPPRAE
jgi:hypothetical protein